MDVVTSTSDVLAIIAAVTVTITTLLSAVTGMIVAIRTGKMQKTGEEAQKTGMEVKHLTNSQNQALKQLVQKQSNEMYDAGLAPTQDDSLKRDAI